MLGTIAEVKTQLGITDSSKDTLLTQLASQVDATIKAYLNRVVEVTSYDEYYNSDGLTYDIFLKDYPVSSASNEKPVVKINGTTQTEGSDYDVDYILGYIHFYSAIPRGFKVIQVTYKAGSGTVPKDINNVFVQMVTGLYQMREQREVKSESLGDYSVSYQITDKDINGLLSQHSIILNAHRRDV